MLEQRGIRNTNVNTPEQKLDCNVLDHNDTNACSLWCDYTSTYCRIHRYVYDIQHEKHYFTTIRIVHVECGSRHSVLYLLAAARLVPALFLVAVPSPSSCDSLTLPLAKEAHAKTKT
jgi:hypothetical protein